VKKQPEDCCAKRNRESRDIRPYKVNCGGNQRDAAKGFQTIKFKDKAAQPA
jgi:hypothetical protein